MEVIVHKNKIEVSFKYSPKFISILKGIKSAFYNAEKKCWALPLEAQDELMDSCKRNNVSITISNSEIMCEEYDNNKQVNVQIEKDCLKTKCIPYKLAQALIEEYGIPFNDDDLNTITKDQMLFFFNKAKELELKFYIH